MNKRIISTILKIIITIAVVCLTVGIYITELNKMISENTLNSISEMASHDKQSIEALINTCWIRLEGISVRLCDNNGKTLEEVQRRLDLEQSTTDFTQIFLLAEDGKIYTKSSVYDPQNEDNETRVDLLPYFENNEKRIVRRWTQPNSNPSVELLQKYVLYGVRLENIEIEGQKMLAIIGISDVNTIQRYINFDSFMKNGVRRGYSSIISSAGNYVIDSREFFYSNETLNLFDLLDSSKGATLSNEEIQQKMNNSETFTFRYYEDRSEKLVYCAPFEGSGVNWYFLQVVDRIAFTEQSQFFVTTSAVALLVLLTLILIMMLSSMRFRKKSIEADAHTRAQSEFLSNMSHEIRTPLNGLIGLNHLVMTNIDKEGNSEQIKTWLKKSHSTANYLLSLVNDILDISKLQAGKVDIINEPILVESLVDAVHSMQWDNIKNRGVDFVVQQDISVPCVMGDGTRIKQILMNIVGNAAKFTPEGGTITLSVSQEVAEDNQVTTIYRCTDTGVGMSKEFCEKIFDAFSQERNKNSNSVKGTGLGMAICKLLTQAMGGDITVESELNKGSTFTVTLPSTKAEAEPEYMNQATEETIAKAKELTESLHSEKPIKILIAEDNELNAEILMEILTEEGFEVVHAQNGQIAVDLFLESAENEFDVILMDMQMPVMDGCTASATIRKLDRADAKSVIIFACTANTFKEDRDRAIESGMDDFLSKPIDVKNMMDKLSKATKKKE